MAPQTPLLSVIIASYNPGCLIEGCLESLKNQKTDQPFEVIVVDSSTDGTTRLIQEKFPEVRLYPFSGRKYCGDARNIGISVSQGEIVAFLDADCRPDRNWINQILKDHQSPAMAIGGAIANGNPESLIGWAAYFTEFSQWMPCSITKGLNDIAGANMSYKKEALRKYGELIEGTYSSDTEFHWRLGKNGISLQFDPRLTVYHHNIDQFSEFLKHEFDHGQAFARVRMNGQDFSKWRRWFYGVFFILLPGWLFLKIGLRNLKNRVYLFHFFKVWPLLILGLISWSLGECTGYLRGILLQSKKLSDGCASGVNAPEMTDDALFSKKEDRADQSLPFFSIIIPTYNRPRQLAVCLDSFLHLDYPRDRFEVILVDDGSLTPLQPVVECYFRQLNVTLLTQTNAGPAAARNTGAQRATGEFFVFTDDDCIPSPDWLQKIADRFSKTRGRAIGGRILNALSRNPYSTASQIIIRAGYAYCNSIPDQATFFTSNNLAVPADQFYSIGGFDATFTTAEDRDFCDRWNHHGFRMTYAPEVLIYHFHELNFQSFWRQHFNYGRGAYRYHQARARRGTGRFRPDIKFYAGFILKPLMEEQRQGFFWVRMPLIMSQVANTIGFFWEGLKQTSKK